MNRKKNILLKDYSIHKILSLGLLNNFPKRSFVIQSKFKLFFINKLEKWLYYLDTSILIIIIILSY